jgi:hypothetical protein
MQTSIKYIISSSIFIALLRLLERILLVPDHVCNLDDGVVLGLGKDALATSTFNVEAEDAERRHLCADG